MAVEQLTSNLDNVAEKTRILVIDDSAVIRKAASKMLNDEFDVITANDGEQGWQTIQQDTSIQVVFIDINMPIMDGYQLIEHVRTCSDEGIRNLPLIVITSEDAEGGAKEKVFKLGATDFISKPFNSFDLKARATAHSNYSRITRVLQEKSHIDPASGLINKQGFALQLKKDLSRVCREQQDLALFQLEISNFKEIFLRVGRASADKIVQLIAKLLNAHIRKEDTVSRIDLCTFFILLPAADPDSVHMLAQRMSDEITGIKARLKGELLQFDVAVGICVVERGYRAEPADVLQDCTEALLKAKNQNKGNVYHHSVKTKSDASKEYEVSIDRLLAKLKRGDFNIKNEQIEAASEQLKPLIALMSNEQKSYMQDL